MEQSVNKYIRLGFVALLLLGSVWILAPFLIILIWGVIIAVALHPLFFRMVNLLKGRRNLTAVLCTLVGLLVVIIPSLFLAGSTMQGYHYLTTAFEQGNLTIPPPTKDVQTWPVIGDKLYAAWDLASHNIRGFINKYSQQFSEIGKWLLESITGFGLTVIQFVASIIISGFLLARAGKGEETSLKIATKLVGDRSADFVRLTARTIRSVVQGILGIALIQAVVSAICFYSAQVPFAGLWALIVLVMAILQLPPLLVLAPITVYVFSIHSLTVALIFAVFATLISVSDSLLKPVFLGRNVDIPTLVILLGAIGGMLAYGILGLFVGAVILALSYKLFMAWLNE